MFTFEGHNGRVHSVSRDESAATILIAEDDRRVRDSLDRYLRLEGYEVVAVPDGAAALKAHDAHRPDLLVLDVSMPNADGLSVCRMLRERGCESQILMLTARHEVDGRVAGLDAGADDYLVKPFAIEELSARVRARLRAAAEAGEGTHRGGRAAAAAATPAATVCCNSTTSRSMSRAVWLPGPAVDRRLAMLTSGGGGARYHLDRRGFIKGGLGAAGVAVAAPLLAACSGRGAVDAPAAAGERIVIVGAGIAALAAADELRIRGFDDIVLLEARDRVGGRIWTSSIGDGIPVELGATWIHGIRGNPVHEIAESNSIRTAPSDYDNSVLYDRDGQEIGPVDAELWRDYMILADELPEESLLDVFEKFASINGLGDDDRRLWLHSLSSMFSHEFGADISELSIMSYDGPSTLRGGDVVFPGGYSQIVDVLSAGRDIRLNHAVTEIDHAGSEAVITTASGETFDADRVVVTVPLGVLKAGALSFTPALPPRMQEAIDSLDMGILNRTCLLFDDAFWDRDVEWIGYAGEHPGQWSETLNLYPYLRRPVLAMFNPGSYGAEIEEHSDQELVAGAVETLEAVFGDVPEPVDAVSTRWGSDRWTRGSYSYLPVGVSFETYREMARPVGERLFFAGEATHSRFPSTVHGALLSGRRAARQIYGLLR